MSTAAPDTSPGRVHRRSALSPSRAADFKRCPLLYRFRAIDRLPETPSAPALRGTVVHAVLERLFGLPAPARDPRAARRLAAEVLGELAPDLRALLGDAEEVGTLLDTWFTLEDPRRLEPEACELGLEVEVGPGAVLRGYVDRLDATPDGDFPPRPGRGCGWCPHRDRCPSFGGTPPPYPGWPAPPFVPGPRSPQNPDS